MVSWISPLSAADKVIYADPSGLPDVDRSKTVEMKTVNSFNKAFNAKNLEYKDVKLPEYFGNLEAYPLTEWRAPQSDFYKKTIDAKEFSDSRKQSGLQPWSNEVALKASLKLREDTELGDKDAKIKDNSLEAEDISKGPNLRGQKLIQIINKGAEAPPIKVGDGFTEKTIKGINEKPGTSSQPK
jgi:hypothetical protein